MPKQIVPQLILPKRMSPKQTYSKQILPKDSIVLIALEVLEIIYLPTCFKALVQTPGRDGNPLTSETVKGCCANSSRSDTNSKTSSGLTAF